MEFKEDTVIPLRVWQDHMMETSFIDVLSNESIYSVKLPSTIDKCKFGHLINPIYLLDIELVKTRKNWVLKGVAIKQHLAYPSDYDDHIKLSEMIKTILKFSRNEQDTRLLPIVIDFFTRELKYINLTEFEAAVLDSEGFLEQHKESTLSSLIQNTKNINNLEHGLVTL